MDKKYNFRIIDDNDVMAVNSFVIGYLNAFGNDGIKFICDKVSCCTRYVDENFNRISDEYDDAFEKMMDCEISKDEFRAIEEKYEDACNNTHDFTLNFIVDEDCEDMYDILVSKLDKFVERLNREDCGA